MSSPSEDVTIGGSPKQETPSSYLPSPSVGPILNPRQSGPSIPRKHLSLRALIGDDDDDDADPNGDDDDGALLELASPVYRANFTAYDCIDPFRSTPVQITPKIHLVLQFSLRIYSYAGNNYKLAFLPSHVRNTISQFPIGAVVQRSVYKEHHLYSLMAAMTARMKHIFAVNPTQDDPEQLRATASYYLRKELLRASRSGNVDKQTILDILFLAVNELQYSRFEDARRHLNIVGKLYHLLDLNEHLDRWISETAAHVDNQLALSTARRPVLERTFDPGPMLPERMAILRREAQNMKFYGYPNPSSMVVPRGPNGSMGHSDPIADLAATLDSRMGVRFTQALKQGAFPPNLARIVSDLVDCIEIAKVVWLSPLAVCFDAEWLCRKARAVLRALLAIAPENTPGPMDIANKCTECARLCLMILMTHACTLIGFQTAKANVQRLLLAKETALKYWAPAIGWSDKCEALDPQTRLDPFVELQAGFVLWGLFTGIWSSAGGPEEEWFMERAVNICRYFGYTSYEDLDDHMAHYLYSKTLQEHSLRRAAQRLLESRQQRNGFGMNGIGMDRMMGAGAGAGAGVRVG